MEACKVYRNNLEFTSKQNSNINITCLHNVCIVHENKNRTAKRVKAGKFFSAQCSQEKVQDCCPIYTRILYERIRFTSEIRIQRYLSLATQIRRPRNGTREKYTQHHVGEINQVPWKRTRGTEDRVNYRGSQRSPETVPL